MNTYINIHIHTRIPRNKFSEVMNYLIVSVTAPAEKEMSFSSPYGVLC